MRERELQSCFYIGSLNHKATSSFPGQPELGFHYIQKFYKSNTTIRLLNKETHKIFDSKQKSRHTPCENHTYRLEITSGKPTRGIRTSKLDAGCPSQQYMCSSSYSQAKMPPRSTNIFKQRVAIVFCRERVFQRGMTKFCAKKLKNMTLLSKTQHI